MYGIWQRSHFPGPKLELAHEQFLAMGPAISWMTIKRPESINSPFESSVSGRMVSLINRCTNDVRWHLSRLGVPWETPPPSNFRRLVLIPTTQFLFLMKHAFGRNNQIGPHPNEWYQKAIMTQSTILKL